MHLDFIIRHVCGYRCLSVNCQRQKILLVRFVKVLVEVSLLSRMFVQHLFKATNKLPCALPVRVVFLTVNGARAVRGCLVVACVVKIQEISLPLIHWEM